MMNGLPVFEERDSSDCLFIALFIFPFPLFLATSDNPLWTESALKYYEEQELSMQVSPNDVVGQMLAAASSHHQHQQQQHQANSGIGGQAPADILSPHYSALLEASRSTKQRQRLPDSEVSPGVGTACRSACFCRP